MIRFFHASIIKYHFEWEEEQVSIIVSQLHKNLKESLPSIVHLEPKTNSAIDLNLTLIQWKKLYSNHTKDMEIILP